ncbi:MULTISPECIES: YciI family protein [Marinobacter]|uniref:YciI family protein n=1 Tax=Marinobacter TaxID=2742 RepID=UPI00124654BD|nr:MULTISPECIES: YciI family protein [Marinobacter]MBL3558567.1 VOC family protein [Marinobacter sp. JB05H06]
MKYMLMRKADSDTEKGVLPSEDMLQAMADYNERMAQAGVFIDGDGLRPTSEGCRIQFRNGEPTVLQGPFEQTSELLAGYSVLEADSLEDALAWAKQWPREDGGGNVTLELRRYYTLEDFAPGAALEKHRSHGNLPREMNVHVAFGGNCREAMEFYAELTAGNLEAMITYGETPAAEDVPAEMHDRIVHSSLNIRGRRLMGADMAGDCYQSPQGAQVHLDYADTEQSERVFNALSKEGTVIMPFEQTFWAHRFGMVKDRFGVQWMISADLEQCQ